MFNSKYVMILDGKGTHYYYFEWLFNMDDRKKRILIGDGNAVLFEDFEDIRLGMFSAPYSSLGYGIHGNCDCVGVYRIMHGEIPYILPYSIKRDKVKKYMYVEKGVRI